MDDLTPSKRIPNRESEYKRGMPAHVQKGLFLLGGVVVGAVIVLLTLQLAGPEIPVPKVVYRDAPTQYPTGGAGVTLPSLTKPGAETLTDPNKPAAGAATNGAAGGPTTGKSMPPFNPFEGSISAMPPKEITGTAVPRGDAPVNPGLANTVKAPPVAAQTPAAEDAPDGLLVTVRLDVNDAGSALGSLRGLASKYKGSAIQFDEQAGQDEPEGALLFVPAAQADKVEKDLGAAGSVAAIDHWNGSNNSRAGRIESAAADRISDLRLKKQTLQEKFFDDAPQIVQIDEEIERIEKSLSRFRGQRPGSKTAVFKIRFLG